MLRVPCLLVLIVVSPLIEKAGFTSLVVIVLNRMISDSELVVLSLSDQELNRLLRLYLRELASRLEDCSDA